MRQRVDAHIALHFINGLQAGKRIQPINIHGAGAANPLTAGTPEGERAVHLILDLDQRVQHHRPALVEINFESVIARVFAGIRVPAIDLEILDLLRSGGRLMRLAGADGRILGQGESGHLVVS